MDENTGPESLLDLAARATGKYISCEEMLRYQPPLDEAIYKKIAYWACPQSVVETKAIANLTLRGDGTWEQGEKDGCVTDIRQIGFMVVADVEIHHKTKAQVSFTFEKQQITSTFCEDCGERIWCSHLVAVVLYRIKNPHKVPIHGPLMETLSTLNRDQLQKLIQYAIDEKPAVVLGKVFRRIDQVRDAASEINKISGLPDSTLGLHSEEETTWDRTMDDIRKNFNKACHDAWVPKYVSPFCLLHLPTNCNKVDVALFRCIDDGWMVTQQCVPFGYILGILFNSLYKCTRAESLLLKTKQ